MKTLLASICAFFAFAAVASAATAPAVSTSPANSVSSNGATLNGTVNPNGEATNWYFEYGTSTSYGSRTSTQNAGSGASPVNVSASVNGLQGAKSYHYRLVASSAGGTSMGADMTFSTGNAPGVTTAAASSLSGTSARLNGSVNPNGQSTSYYFEYGTSTTYGLKTSSRNAGSGTRSTNVSISVSGLTAGGSYHFRLVATNASGTTFGADQSLSLLSSPLVVTNAAQNVQTTSVTLTGTVDPKGRSTNWHFDYGTTTAYGSKTQSHNAGSGSGTVAVSAVVSGLTVGTTYHFRLVASNSVGTSTGADVSFLTAPTVTINRSALRIVAGHYVKLYGTVSSGQAGVKVTMLAQPFGESTLTPVTDVLTGGGGSWSFLAKPSIATTYQASALGGTSIPLTVGVQPAVSFQKITHARFSTHVKGAGSFAGKVVQLQRFANGHWKTIKRTRLNSNSTAIFQAAVLPKGLSKVRIALSVNQAGPGYLGGFSRTLIYRR